MSINNPTHNQDLLIFQFFDTEKLVNFYKKINKFIPIYTKRTHLSQKIPIFWVKKTTKFIGRKKSQPTTG
jgi:hypothetical protein